MKIQPDPDKTRSEIIKVKNDLAVVKYIKKQMLDKGWTLEEFDNSDYFELMDTLSAKRPEESIQHTGDDLINIFKGHGM